MRLKIDCACINKCHHAHQRNSWNQMADLYLQAYLHIYYSFAYCILHCMVYSHSYCLLHHFHIAHYIPPCPPRFTHCLLPPTSCVLSLAPCFVSIVGLDTLLPIALARTCHRSLGHVTHGYASSSACCETNGCCTKTFLPP